METAGLVLVTGISGFVGAECAYQLLEQGYRVRGTVRSLKNEEKVKPIRNLHPACADRLQLVEADLLKEDGWDKALEGVTDILHVASPLPLKAPSKRDALVPTAVNGTLNVLKAATKCSSIKTIVVTSSALVYMDGKSTKKPFMICDETEIGDEARVAAYPLSKFRAMKAAWDFYRESPRDFKMVMLHPSLIIGPSRIDVVNASSSVSIYFMKRKLPSCPKIALPTVDVRDVAKAHILALENAADMNGESYIVSNRTFGFLEIGQTLHKKFSRHGYKVPHKPMGNCLFKMACLFDKGVRLMKPYYNKTIELKNDKFEKATQFTEWTNLRQSLIEMTEEQIRKGIIPDKMKK